MPCVTGKELYHLLYPEQFEYDSKKTAKTSASKSQRTCPPKRENQRLSHTCAAVDNNPKHIEFIQKVQNDCKDVYRAHKIDIRDIKGQYDEREELQQIENQLETLPANEATSAVTGNLIIRLRKKEEMLKNRLLARVEPVVSKKDLERLHDAAKVVTIDDRIEGLAKEEKEAKQMNDDYERTKKHFKQMDDARRRAQEKAVKNEDLFGAQEKLKVLERAFVAKHEQEEEVKRVNQIILNAKCHAVRDAQIQEKTEMQRELHKEEERLEKIVREAALRQMNAEDYREEKHREIKAKYANDIREQLSQRESLRFLQAERIGQEAQLLRKANEAMKRDEDRQIQLDKERRKKFREELENVLQLSNLFKKMLCEQEREADMRIAAYLKQKHERERALSAERKVSKEAQERRQQRIFVVAQKILESKTQREEMGYLREQERIEREYRRKEKELVLRKKQIERELAEARELQIQETKYRQALQIARDEHDFNVLIQNLKQGQEKQRKEDMEREKRRRCYRAEIIRQMGDRETERMRLKELEMDQAAAWRERERQRDANIQAVINAKLQAMRNASLPEKYIHDVEIQLKKIQEHKKNI